MEDVPNYNKENGFLPSVMVFQAAGGGEGGNVLYNSTWDSTVGGNERSGILHVPGQKKKLRIRLGGEDGVKVVDDIHVRVLHNSEQAFRFNFHTGFLKFHKDFDQLFFHTSGINFHTSC